MNTSAPVVTPAQSASSNPAAAPNGAQNPAAAAVGSTPAVVDYRTDPSRYRHVKLSFDGPVATL